MGVRQVLAAAALLAAGCGGDNVAPVRGRVTVGGQPAGEGRIAFYPADGRAAVGAIGADGTFALTTFREGDGALVGPHKVTIDVRRVTAAAAPGPKSLEEEIAKGSPPAARSAVVWVVPRQYAEPASTPLTAEVRRGANVIDFEIPAPGR